MFTLHIEHSVGDYDAWKRMFDSDPLNRKTAGVTSYRVMRPIDDPNAVRVDLEFDSREAGETMKAALEAMWQGPAAAMMRDPHARLWEIDETRSL